LTAAADSDGPLLSAPSPRSCGERVGVRGSFCKLGLAESPPDPTRTDRMSNAELAALAETLARWVDPVLGAPTVYLFGSRVRGDHRPDSDVDVRLYLQDWTIEEWTYEKGQARNLWWMEQEATRCAELQAQLPGRLDLGRDSMDWTHKVDREIAAARKRGPVLELRKVVCLWTPPKLGQVNQV
jgi:hypothetical protein